mgnify:CR=1 FL=1
MKAITNLTNSLRNNLQSTVNSELYENIDIGEEFSSLIDFGSSKQEIENDKDFLDFLEDNNIAIKFDFMGVHFIKMA